eukprot:4744636-Pleurochrysis_carterae.AAC.1
MAIKSGNRGKDEEGCREKRDETQVDDIDYNFAAYRSSLALSHLTRGRSFTALQLRAGRLRACVLGFENYLLTEKERISTTEQFA